MNHTPRVSSHPIGLAARALRDSLIFVRVHQTFWTIAFVLLSAVALQAAVVSAQVFSVSGTAEYAGPGSSSYAPLTKGQILPIGSTVRTGDDGVAVLVTTPGSAIQLGQQLRPQNQPARFCQVGFLGHATHRRSPA